MDIATSRPHRQFALVSSLLILALALLIAPAVVMAQGLEPDDEQITGYVVLGEEVAGPHLVQVQVSPAAPKVGIVRFAVRVRNLETGEDIDDAIVRIFGTPSERGEKQYSPALNSPFDPIFYLSQLDFEESGIWAVDVEVESSLGTGSTVLSIRVSPPSRGATANVWGSALYLLVTLAFIGGATWLWYSSKKARQRQRSRMPQEPRKPQKL